MAGLGASGSASVVNPNYRQFQAPKAQPKGNFMTHLLPSLTGTAGGVGGGALGGAIAGSAILPGVGTVAGGLLGALLGGAAGGAGGKVVENHMEHQALGNGVLGAGIENGVLSAGPLRLLKAGKLAAGVGREAAPGLAESLIKSGASDAGQAAAAPLKTSAAGKLEAFGNKQLASQWGTLDKPTIRATNPMQTVGKLADAGIIKPNDAERVAAGLTGSNGVLNQAVVRAVGSAGQVPTHNVANVMEQAIAQHGLVDTQAASVRKVVEAQLGKLGDNGTAAPAKVMGVMKSIEQRIADLGGKGGNYKMATPERIDQAKALQAVHNELQDSLYKTAGADKNIGGVLTPEVRQQLINLHPGNDQWAAHVDKNIMSSKTVGQLRSAQAPFVKASQMIDNADANSFSTGGRLGNALSNGALPGLRGMAVEAAHKVVKDPAARIAGTTARKLAGAGGEAGSLLGALSAPSGKAIARNDLLGGLLLNNTTGKASADTPGSSQGYTADEIAQAQQAQQADLSQATDQTSQDDPNSPLSPANVEANVQAILAGGGKMSDATAYLSLVKTMQDLKGNGATTKPMNSTSAGVVSDTQQGIKTLGDLSGSIAGSNANNPILGKLRGMNPLDTNAQALQAQINAARQIIGKAMEGGVLRKEDEVKYAKILPTMTDTDAVAQAKIQYIQQQLAQKLGLYQQNIGQGGGGTDTSSLLNALGAQ